jgi:hypothetical protein
VKPFSPSRSILPAQMRHCIGRNSGVPKTSPKHTVKTATTVSMDISRGRVATVEGSVLCDAIEDIDAVLVE